MLGADLDVYPGPPAQPWELCDASPPTKTAGAFPDQEPFDGFAVYLAVRCTSRGLDIPRFRQKAQAAFQVYEDAVVEDQFWNGTIAPTNPHLTDTGTTVLNATAVDIVSGFALLEQELANKQQAGIIHLSPWLLTYAANAQLVHQEGAFLRTMLGTLVVPGNGYDGSKPEEVGTALAAGTEYAYVTNGVRVLRAPNINVLGATDAEALARNTNDLTVIVEREYVVAWDGMVQGAALIDPTPVV